MIRRCAAIAALAAVAACETLQPGEQHQYTSGTAIATPVGTMRGSYQMTAEDGREFEASIPEFALSMPRVLH